VDRLQIAAVVVAYRPDPDQLTEVLAAVLPQVGPLLLVDNGGLDRAVVPSRPNVEVLDMGFNAGIAAAQNAGIERAKLRGAKFVLLLDQDSVAAPDMVRCLLAALEERRAEGRKIAACGPSYELGDGQKSSGFLAAGSFGFREVTPDRGHSSVACDFLIASGMLIPVDTLAAVGGMDESLFIDHVDTDWCFRAASHGFRCFGVPGAVMQHRLGQSCRSVRIGGRKRRLPRHPALRYYFIVRNSVLLRHRKYMPPAWRRHDLLRLAGLMFFHGLSPRDGFAVMRMATRGFVDGFRGRSGPGLAA